MRSRHAFCRYGHTLALQVIILLLLRLLVCLVRLLPKMPTASFTSQNVVIYAYAIEMRMSANKAE